MKLIILLFTLAIFSCSDIVSSNYETYQEAVNDNLFDRGWLPKILPESAFNITTTNNLDRNTSKGKFEIPKNELNIFIESLEKLGEGVYSYGNVGSSNYWVFSIQENGNVSYELQSN